MMIVAWIHLILVIQLSLSYNLTAIGEVLSAETLFHEHDLDNTKHSFMRYGGLMVLISTTFLGTVVYKLDHFG